MAKKHPKKKGKKMPKAADPKAPYGTRADGTPRQKPGPKSSVGENTRQRSLRVPDALWAEWQAVADKRGVSLSEAIRQLMCEWAEKNR